MSNAAAAAALEADFLNCCCCKGISLCCFLRALFWGSGFAWPQGGSCDVRPPRSVLQIHLGESLKGLGRHCLKLLRCFLAFFKGSKVI